jgi:hypothetical protein
MTCSKISNISYNLIFTTKFNDSSILITIISWDYLNFSVANHGQLKENLFLPLFNTNFISKSFGSPLHNSVARMWGKARKYM